MKKRLHIQKCFSSKVKYEFLTCGAHLRCNNFTLTVILWLLCFSIAGTDVQSIPHNQRISVSTYRWRAVTFFLQKVETPKMKNMLCDAVAQYKNRKMSLIVNKNTVELCSSLKDVGKQMKIISTFDKPQCNWKVLSISPP